MIHKLKHHPANQFESQDTENKNNKHKQLSLWLINSHISSLFNSFSPSTTVSHHHHLLLSYQIRTHLFTTNFVELYHRSWRAWLASVTVSITFYSQSHFSCLSTIALTLTLTITSTLLLLLMLVVVQYFVSFQLLLIAGVVWLWD